MAGSSKRPRRMMCELAVTIVAVVAGSLGGCSGESRASIGPSDTFMLGGEQRMPFVVRGENIGTTSVEVMAKSDGIEQLIVVAKPGDAIENQFAAGQIAMFRNPSAAEIATVRLELSRDVQGLSMRYRSSQAAKSLK